MSKERDVNLSSIRHGLSHHPSMLNNRKTLEILGKIFGSNEIDLSRKKHQDQFYKYYVELLRETDKLLYTLLKDLLKKSKIIFEGFGVFLIN